jgi:hypothetical protein
MPRRRHLILKAVIKDLSKVAGAPFEVGIGPISIFASDELQTRLKELVEALPESSDIALRGLRARLPQPPPLGKRNELRSGEPSRAYGSMDGVDGVIYRAVHNSKAAGRVDGRGLRAREANNNQKCSVPLRHLANRFRRLCHCGRKVCGGQQGDSRAGQQ